VAASAMRETLSLISDALTAHCRRSVAMPASITEV
jgi:hypothetical protein